MDDDWTANGRSVFFERIGIRLGVCWCLLSNDELSTLGLIVIQGTYTTLSLSHQGRQKTEAK
jgi:hypothetical protein